MRVKQDWNKAWALEAAIQGLAGMDWDSNDYVKIYAICECIQMFYVLSFYALFHVLNIQF